MRPARWSPATSSLTILPRLSIGIARQPSRTTSPAAGDRERVASEDGTPSPRHVESTFGLVAVHSPLHLADILAIDACRGMTLQHEASPLQAIDVPHVPPKRDVRHCAMPTRHRHDCGTTAASGTRHELAVVGAI